MTQIRQRRKGEWWNLSLVVVMIDAALERLLGPENASITLITLERAASALGKKLSVKLA